MNILVRRFNSTPTSQPDTKLIKKVKDLILQGLHVEALHLYKNQLHLHVDTFTSIVPSIIKSCSLSQTHHGLGLQLHCHSLKNGFDSESIVSNSIISFYAKSQDIKSAGKMFDEMPQRDCISWNTMINCFSRNGYCFESLKMFKEMYESGFVAKPELIAGILSVCVQCGFTRAAKTIHTLSIVDERFENSVFLSTALIDLYWRSGDSVMAFHVFNSIKDKNEVTWTSMILGYVGIHDYSMALNCFRQMQLEGINPNRVTLITILPACDTINLIKTIHAYAFRHNLNSDIRLLSSLIHLYSNHKDSLPLAKLIFKLSTQKDIVIWSSIITGCSNHQESSQISISLFNQMQKEGLIRPNSITLMAILTACTNIPSITLGNGIHGYVIKTGFDSDLSITNSLINMYSKCGSLNDSDKVFQETPTPDCISWSAIINAYGIHGYGEKALELFSKMKEKGIEHDSITLLAVLSACNHSGFVEKGENLFSKFLKDDRMLINLEHYACYIDLLGRAGRVECAGEVLRRMPMKPSAKIMSSLVSSCKIHGRLDFAENMLSWFIELECGDDANYALLSMIYGEFGKWLNMEGVHREMKLRGLKKSYGFSRLEN